MNAQIDLKMTLVFLLIAAAVLGMVLLVALGSISIAQNAAEFSIVHWGIDANSFNYRF